MDIGASVCTAKSPACGICPLSAACLALKNGLAGDLPARIKPARKPTRVGSIYVARREDGAWLLERRKETGLLGGMLSWPGSDWAETPQNGEPPLDAGWRRLDGEVRHTFTHFHLRLTVHIAVVPSEITPKKGEFWAGADFNPADLPTVMRKVFDLAKGQLGEGEAQSYNSGHELI